jgi:transposase InsO family protein
LIQLIQTGGPVRRDRWAISWTIGRGSARLPEPLQPKGGRLGHEHIAGRRSGHRRLDDGLQATASGPKVDPSQRQATYTSLAFGNRAAELGIIRFFGSTGDCFDNSAIEAVWATPQPRELAWIYRRRTWPWRDLLLSVLFDYIEGLYNSQRTRSGWATVPQASTNRSEWLRGRADR